ncbi:DUF6732 family protein [Roseibium algae]|uniref:DUF6732 family protein n=1 Tax=Roseibium algae TaxID=3123038 RepID=A0ABU8TQR5_9HYPH
MMTNLGTWLATTSIFAIAVAMPSLAMAHPGHLGELAGHSHWIGVIALAGAALVAGVAALKGRKKDASGQDDETQADAKPEAEAA